MSVLLTESGSVITTETGVQIGLESISPTSAYDTATRAFTDNATFTTSTAYLAQNAEMLSLFPKPWAGDSAYAPTGLLFSATSIFATMLLQLQNEVTYVNSQKRIGTSTGDNLTTEANDFFGFNQFPRANLVVGTNAVPETDVQYRTRLLAAIIAPNNTLAAVQNAVNSYLVNGYAAAVALNAKVLGLDTVGGLDSYGALDGTPNTVPPIPVATCFDLQSNPKLAARVNLQPGQFVILLTYGGLGKGGFFLNYTSKLNYSYLLDDTLQAITPPSALIAIVQQVKAQGLQPLFYDNRG